jgi:hypothetical protein
MVQGKATAQVSDDGKCVICRSANGHVRWSRSAPSSHDWLRLAKHPVSVDLEAGRFQYVGDEIDGMIIAVFTPGRSLDFNLTYSADTGDLIRIHEAR